VESRHEIHLALGKGTLETGCGDPDQLVFLRSAAKPFQAAAIVASGALDRFGADDEEIAVVAASHSGEELHTTRVRSLLAKLGLDETALGCGVHPPLDAATAERVGRGASPVHHNCSGKHAGMLALALHLGISPERYLDLDGPVQRAIHETIAAVCGLSRDQVVTAVDGCSAATFAVPLSAAAGAFSLLARPDRASAGLRQPLERVARAMSDHPHLIGGTGRFDTRLMLAAKGRLLAKGGAEGVQGIADRESGLGLCLKVADGSSRAVAPATIEALRQAGWIDREALRSLEDQWHPEITNYAGKRVGRIEAKLTLARSS